MESALVELKDRLGKFTDLRRAEFVLGWDMTVLMPRGGAPTRAAQLATLHEFTHEYEVEERFGELFEEGIDEHLARGNFQALHTWLRENIYSLGRKLTLAETIERVVGGPIDPQPYLAYLRDKLGTPASA